MYGVLMQNAHVYFSYSCTMVIFSFPLSFFKITFNCYIVFHWVNKFLQDFHLMLLLAILRYKFIVKALVYSLLYPQEKSLEVEFQVPSILALLTRYLPSSHVSISDLRCPGVLYVTLQTPTYTSVSLEMDLHGLH